jgi:hypothetical protein
MQLITNTIMIGPPTLKNQFQFVSGYLPLISGGKKLISMFVRTNKTPRLITIATKNLVIRDLFMLVLSLYRSKLASFLKIFFKTKLMREIVNETTADINILSICNQKNSSHSL